MSTQNKTSFSLSASRRELLEKLLAKEGLRVTTPGIRPRNEREHLPLSFAQQRLWFIDQLRGGSPFYNVPVALSLSGPLVPEAMRRAVAEIVRRHEALRTTFLQQDGNLCQHISTSFEFPWSQTDVSSTISSPSS